MKKRIQSKVCLVLLFRAEMAVMACFAIPMQCYSSEPRNVDHEEAGKQFVQKAVQWIEAGNVPDSYKEPVGFTVGDEKDAAVAFEVFLSKNVFAKGNEKKMSFSKVMQVDQYFVAAIKESSTLPPLLLVKKGGNTVFLFGGNP